jgi:redox-sensitive bicupin YhaK (pirin superfamily)
MITTRSASACGQADYGWLQARYSFSFGHYFDPKLMGYASLRVLNQEVLAPGAAFQPRHLPSSIHRSNGLSGAIQTIPAKI